ncbi:MAG: hypothetical protein U5R06_11070 [candidate division KSB1 bacterium]|nr:hypothetical protein [candidate division KSB1 bacterium]
MHKEFVWSPDILTMGVHFNHHLGDFSEDDMTSGVWRPKGFGKDFYNHDAEKRMIYIAPGGHHTDWSESGDFPFASVADYVEVLVDYIDRGKIPAGQLYTATLAVPQSVIFDQSKHEKLADQFKQLAALVGQRRVVYAHFQEIADIWQETYDGDPTMLSFDAINEQDYTRVDPDTKQK